MFLNIVKKDITDGGGSEWVIADNRLYRDLWGAYCGIMSSVGRYSKSSNSISISMYSSNDKAGTYTRYYGKTALF